MIMNFSLLVSVWWLVRKDILRGDSHQYTAFFFFETWNLDYCNLKTDGKAVLSPTVLTVCEGSFIYQSWKNRFQVESVVWRNYLWFAEQLHKILPMMSASGSKIDIRKALFYHVKFLILCSWTWSPWVPCMLLWVWLLLKVLYYHFHSGVGKRSSRQWLVYCCILPFKRTT